MNNSNYTTYQILQYLLRNKLVSEECACDETVKNDISQIITNVAITNIPLTATNIHSVSATSTTHTFTL